MTMLISTTKSMIAFTGISLHPIFGDDAYDGVYLSGTVDALIRSDNGNVTVSGELHAPSKSKSRVKIPFTMVLADDGTIQSSDFDLSGLSNDDKIAIAEVAGSERYEDIKTQLGREYFMAILVRYDNLLRHISTVETTDEMLTTYHDTYDVEALVSGINRLLYVIYPAHDVVVTDEHRLSEIKQILKTAIEQHKVLANTKLK